MTDTITYNICPEDLIQQSRDECRAVLDEYCHVRKLPRILISFIARDGSFSFHRGLTTDPDQVIKLSHTTEGLMGLALLKGRTMAYPIDPGAEEKFIDVDRRTRFEIASLFRLDGVPTGVMLVDFFEGEPLPASVTELKRIVEACAAKISAILDSFSQSEDDIRAKLIDIVEQAKAATGSERGYIAYRMPDGALKYYWKDPVFIPLSATGGICGKAFQTGKEVNVADVWKDSSYVASDPQIQSELIIPVLDNNQVIAILNLESRNRSHFRREQCNQARIWAGAALDPLCALKAVNDRRRRDPIVALSAFVQDVTSWAVTDVRTSRIRDHVETKVIELALHRLGDVLQETPLLWRSREDPVPKGLMGLEWDDQAAGGVLPVAGQPARKIVWAPIRDSSGELKAILGVEVERARPHVDNLVPQICLVAGRLIEAKIETALSAAMEQIIFDVSLERNTIGLHLVAERLAEVMSCDHCTIFGRLNENFSDKLVVVASTAAEFHLAEEGYYRIDYRDGLTGFIAASKRAVIFDGTAQVAENIAFLPDRGSWRDQANKDKCPQPERKGKISELDAGAGRLAGDEELSAFIGIPVLRPSDEEVIGVVRLHRMKRRFQRGMIDTLSQRRLALVCGIMGLSFGSTGLFVGARTQRRITQ